MSNVWMLVFVFLLNLYYAFLIAGEMRSRKILPVWTRVFLLVPPIAFLIAIGVLVFIAGGVMGSGLRDFFKPSND
jgi:hypothetical protein